MTPCSLTDAQVAQFHKDGFLLMEGLFDREEVDLLRRVAEIDQGFQGRVSGRRDAQGGVVKLALSNDLQDDIYAAFVRSPRVVGPMERFLDGEVYHYHNKMILKESKVGGAWEWHQDYGYWYNNGCLFPDMASCMIAVDAANKENGCLQVLRGSHLIGRINHGPIGDQTGADLERVAVACERLETVYAEMGPGSAIFFHSNTLHRSDQNHSERPRWAFICCYNAARNDPYKDSHHPRYQPLEVWPDDRIKTIGRRQLSLATA